MDELTSWTSYYSSNRNPPWLTSSNLVALKKIKAMKIAMRFLINISAFPHFKVFTITFLSKTKTS